MKPWSLSGDRIRLRLNHDSAIALQECCTELIAVYDRDDDAALARILPNAYPDDAEAAAEFRRFTADSLLDTKRGNARRMQASLDASGLLTHGVRRRRRGSSVEIDRDEAWMWLRVFTDIRLTMATRLGIESVADLDQLFDQRNSNDVEYALSVFEWLADLQHTLVSTLDGY